jgi:hypothetical protein
MIMNKRPNSGLDSGKVFRSSVPAAYFFVALISFILFYFFIIVTVGLRCLDVDTLLISAATGAYLGFPVALYLVFFNKDRLSSEGVCGNSFRGVRRFVRWQDIVAVKPLRILNLRFLRLYPADGTCPVWMGLFHAHEKEFDEELKRLAPANSPILTHTEQTRISTNAKKFANVTLAVYFGAYIVLSWRGGYVSTQSGQVRLQDSGWAISDIVQWQPRFAWFQLFREYDGTWTFRGNGLGCVFAPLVLCDQTFVHKTVRLFDAKTGKWIEKQGPKDLKGSSPESRMGFDEKEDRDGRA